MFLFFFYLGFLSRTLLLVGDEFMHFFLAALSHFRVSFQRSSRTPLCHFDKVRTAVLFPLSSIYAAPQGLHFVILTKLEGQREQPGDSANLSL